MRVSDRSYQIFNRRTDCNVLSTTDKYMTSKAYEMYDEKICRLDLDGRAKIVQRNYRAYRLRKYLKECARIYREIMKRCGEYREEKMATYRYVDGMYK